MSSIDSIKNLLLKNKVNFSIFNNNYIFESKFNLPKNYFNLFEGSFFVLFFSDISLFFNLNLNSCFLFACLYNGYFIIIFIFLIL